MATQLTPIRKAWYRWKSLKLPWRKRFLVGLDLQGNTYWEFKDAITANRMRRIVQYPPSTHHSDLKITPQWHQWLRHTRSDPPSLTEQSQDLVRQEELKVLAARADARWAAKESYLDAPSAQSQSQSQSQSLPPIEGAMRKNGGEVDPDHLVENPTPQKGEETDHEMRPAATETEVRGRRSRGATTTEQIDKKDPWKLARGGPSEDWQPSAWGGEATSRK